MSLLILSILSLAFVASVLIFVVARSQRGRS